MSTDTGEDHSHPSIRLIEIEKNGEQCGFHLTRTKWDPYPWVSSVDKDSAAYAASLKTGDCVLEVNGEDILGKRISDIADIVKSNSEQVSLLLWNAGVDVNCTPESLCCGPLPKHLQKLTLCLTTILAFLECPVCLETIPRPTYQCDNGHLICIKCRTKTERCPVCRIRFHRGRSLMADHVFTTMTDTFAPLEESEKTRLMQIHNIFKQTKNKNKVIPDIKITEYYTNKLIFKIVGKSSSVDNLTTSKHLIINDTAERNCSQLKTKSLSANEIFLLENSDLSRNASSSRLSKHYLNAEKKQNLENQSPSFHGSFEYLETRNSDLNSPVCGSFNSMETAPSNNIQSVSYYCPFSNNCATRLKGVNCMFAHFAKDHCTSGPLVQYFTASIELFLRDFRENQENCYTIFYKGQTFFLKLKLYEGEINYHCDILLWVWCLGCRMSSRNYGVQIELKNVSTKEVLLGVRSSIFSLMSVSSQEIEECKKGVYLSAKSIKALGFSSNELLLKANIFEN